VGPDLDVLTASLLRIQHDDDEWAMGVMVVDGTIITAAHVLPRIPKPGDDQVFASIRSFSDDAVQATALVTNVDPCTDIAVLGCPDDQLADEYKPLLKGMHLASVRLAGQSVEPLHVHIPTHDGAWLAGTTSISNDDQVFLRVELDDDARVEGGTSGAPVFDDAGRVVAVVSRAPDDRAEVDVVRLFAIDILCCPRCQGRLTVLAAINDPGVAQKILRHLGLPTVGPWCAPARAPPELELDLDGDTDLDPDAGFEVDAEPDDGFDPDVDVDPEFDD
jgi:Trypsin-like peptidase domain